MARVQQQPMQLAVSGSEEEGGPDLMEGGGAPLPPPKPGAAAAGPSGPSRHAGFDSGLSFDVPAGGRAGRAGAMPTDQGMSMDGSIEALIKQAKKKLKDAVDQFEKAIAKADAAYAKAMASATQQKAAANAHLEEAKKMHDNSIIKAIVNIVVMVVVCAIAAFFPPVGMAAIPAAIGAGALALGLGQVCSQIAGIPLEKMSEKDAKAAATAEGQKADFDAQLAQIEKIYDQAWQKFNRTVSQIDSLLSGIMEAYSEVKRARASAFGG